MTIYQTLDAVPLWIILILSVLLLCTAVELGYRLGRRRTRLPLKEDQATAGSWAAATVGLLAFMLAFTFGLAGNRFDARKRLVVEEANAIGTTFLRARLLAEPQAMEIQNLLREYVNVRLLGAKGPEDFVRLKTEEVLVGAIRRSQELHEELWLKTKIVTDAQPGSEIVALFVDSLNKLIDLHGERMAVAVRYRIPAVIWITLYVLAVLSMFVMGFHDGLASPGRSVTNVIVTFAFVLVLSLIIDLDRGHEGFLQVGHDALFDVRDSMDAAPR